MRQKSTGAGTRSPRTATTSARVLADARRVREGCLAACALGSRERGRLFCLRLSCAKLLDYAAVAVGARRPDSRGLPIRREHLSNLSRGTATASPSGSAISIASIGRLGLSGGSQVQLPAWAARSLLSAAAVSVCFRTAWTKRGIAGVNTVEHQPAVFYLHPWESTLISPDSSRFAGWRGCATMGTSQRLRDDSDDWFVTSNSEPSTKYLVAERPPPSITRVTTNRGRLLSCNHSDKYLLVGDYLWSTQGLGALVHPKSLSQKALAPGL